METKKLYRLPSEGMIAGVCAGLGDYLTTDPTIIRLIFVFLFFAGMSGGLIYILMWLIVPVKSQDSPVVSDVQVVNQSEPADTDQES